MAYSLRSFPIFDQLSEEEEKVLTDSGKIREITLLSGEEVEGKAVYLVDKGSLVVTSGDREHPVILRYLREGDIFGVAMLYSENEMMSVITAKEKTRILVVPEDVISVLMTQNPDFLKTYLAYLCNRISFLSRKISLVTAGTSVRKLISYLMGFNKKEFDLPITYSDLARSLDMGRASLYRAFDLLLDNKMIEKEGNHIKVLEQEEL